MAQRYDAAVIGGGPGGYSAAIRIAQSGRRVALFEKKSLGGTCLNIGCIPTKYLLEQAELIEKLRVETRQGILKDAGRYSWKKIQQQKEQVVSRLVSGIEGILKSFRVDVIRAEALLEKPGEIRLRDGDVRFKADAVIIATGSRVFLPHIKGVPGENIIDSTGALNLGRVPDSMVIIGGGAIGLEFADIYSSLGTRVTILEMLDHIARGEDMDVIHGLESALRKKQIDIITGAGVTEISNEGAGKKVSYSIKSGQNECHAEYVMLAAGRVANTSGIDLKALGICIDGKGNIAVNEKMETNIPGIYAIGDVTGGYQFAHSAYLEADIAARNIMGENAAVDYTFIPRCIYTSPQTASVGLTEDEAKDRGIPVETGVFPYAGNGKAVASGHTDGFVKVISDKSTEKIIGVHILGEYATEIISAAVVAANSGVKTGDFGGMVFPHPTVSEAFREAVLSAGDMAVHLPKSASRIPV